MGVAILPRFAATVSSTTSLTSRSGRSIIRNTNIVKGTNVIRVTSLVMTILQKKHSATIIRDSRRTLRAIRNRVRPSRAKTPSD